MAGVQTRCNPARSFAVGGIRSGARVILAIVRRQNNGYTGVHYLIAKPEEKVLLVVNDLIDAQNPSDGRLDSTGSGNCSYWSRHRSEVEEES